MARVKTKWNRGNSIPIDSLTFDELEEAIHEWAEGSEILEELLWLCYEKSVYTTGCDAGDHHFAYIDFDITKGNTKNLQKLINAALKMRRCSILVKFEGNPRSGPDWCVPTLGLFPLKKGDVKSFFKLLCKSLKRKRGAEPREISKQFLNIVNFLEDKETGLSVRLERNGGYRFILDSFMNSRNWDYFTEIFESAGLEVMHHSDPKAPVLAWGITVEKEHEMVAVLSRVYEVMKNNWTLEIPDKLTPDMDFNCMAIFMRRQFGTDEEGIAKLKEWVDTNWEKDPSEICG